MTFIVILIATSETNSNCGASATLSKINLFVSKFVPNYMDAYCNTFLGAIFKFEVLEWPSVDGSPKIYQKYMLVSLTTRWK